METLWVSNLSAAVDIPVIATVARADADIRGRLSAGASILNVAGGVQTPEIVASIRGQYPDIPIIASDGNTNDSIRRTIDAGANGITYTPPSTGELLKAFMISYREGKPLNQ